MPSNEHFWQGVEIDWTGEIIEVASRHGSSTFFTSEPCNWGLGVGETGWSALYNAERYQEYLVAAKFSVRGRIAFRDGRLVIIPSQIERQGPWMTEENGLIDQYLDQRYQRSLTR